MNVDIKCDQMVLRLKRSLYGLKDAAQIWKKLLLENFQAMGSKEVEATPCGFVMKGLMVICYGDDHMVFADIEKFGLSPNRD